MRLLVYRDHSRLELKRKLQSRFPDYDGIELVLDGLEERGYLDEERFVSEYLASRKRKGYGPLRIKAELQDRGISKDLISSYLLEDDGEWYQLMLVAAATKVGISPTQDHKTQQKAARFLEYRGFSTSMIRRYLWDDE